MDRDTELKRKDKKKFYLNCVILDAFSKISLKFNHEKLKCAHTYAKTLTIEQSIIIFVKIS